MDRISPSFPNPYCNVDCACNDSDNWITVTIRDYLFEIFSHKDAASLLEIARNIPPETTEPVETLDPIEATEQMEQTDSTETMNSMEATEPERSPSNHSWSIRRLWSALAR